MAKKEDNPVVQDPVRRDPVRRDPVRRDPAGPDMYFRMFNEINIIAQLSSRMFEQRLPPGMTLSQFAVLNWFTRVDVEASPGRLATAFQVTRGAMTNTLKKLESKALVQVSPDPESGRQKRVVLTDAGRSMRNDCLAAVGPLLSEFSEASLTGDLAQLIESLAAIRQYLDDYRYAGSGDSR